MFIVKVFNSKGRLMATHPRLSSDTEARSLAARETLGIGRGRWEATYEFNGKHVATYKGGVLVQHSEASEAEDLAPLPEHAWVADTSEPEGAVERCARSGCTVRRTADGAAWQRKKGAHWRRPGRDVLPLCTGKDVPAHDWGEPDAQGVFSCRRPGCSVQRANQRGILRAVQWRASASSGWGLEVLACSGIVAPKNNGPTSSRAAPGQVWEDTCEYPEGSGYAKNPPTLEVTEVSSSYAHGIRQPSGRKTRVKLDAAGGIAGYRLTDRKPLSLLAVLVPQGRAS